MKVFDFLPDDDTPAASIDVSKLLPLVHTAPWASAVKILWSNCIKKEFCDFFQEELLYFFYARPAKRTNQKYVLAYLAAPVVFIVKPELDEIKRVFPFDSGAYDKYIEYEYLNADAQISHHIDSKGSTKSVYKDSHIYNYEIPHNFSAIIQYIQEIYGNNDHYYADKYKNDRELSPTIIQNRRTNADLDNLLNLISSPNTDGLQDQYGLDDRRKTIEIQIPNNYNLYNNLLAVICPMVFYNDDKLAKKIVHSGVEPLHYQYCDAKTVEDHIRIIYNATKNYYVRNRYIKGKSA